MSSKPGSNTNCLHGVCNPRRTQGLLSQPPRHTHNLVEIQGPGEFIAAEISKQGGNSDLTFVNLDIDGRNVTNFSFAAAENSGFTQYNPYGILLLRSNALKTFVIGFSTPLHFEQNLRLGVIVDETDIEQILANVIHGTS